MIARPLEWEGTWEEILVHSRELAGKRVHLRVVGPGAEVELSDTQRETLAALDEICTTPLSTEEARAFDDWDRHPERYRLNLRDQKDHS